MNLSPKTDAAEVRWGDYREGYFVDASLCRSIEIELHGTIEQLKISKHREYVAIRVCDEERKRALRESNRVTESRRKLARALELLDEAFGFVNPPLADSISEYLSQFTVTDSFPPIEDDRAAAKKDFGNQGA